MQLRTLLRDWRPWWLLLLLPVALFLPAMPIDETRYLAVAWEMRVHGDWLLLHLNGAPYADKGPLLFWMINLAWSIAGISVWIVRVGVLAMSFASLLLLGALVRRLAPGGEGAALAARAMLVFAGFLYIALFSSAIMFDVLLTAFVLLVLHGLVDLDRGRWPRGVLIYAAGLGLGLLTKGPVVLLDAGLVALLAPWWSERARAQPARWYAAVLAGVVGSVAIALVWALAAYGAQGFWDAIVVRQTVGRVAKSFAHQRPLWWYFMVLPLMVMPWTLALRARAAVWRELVTSRTQVVRFALAWFVPAFVAFCAVSGKQPHYLLPLLPAVAVLLAQLLGADGARLRPGLFGALLVLVGVAFAAVPYLAANAHDIALAGRLADSLAITDATLDVLAGVWPVWGVLAAVLGAWLLRRRDGELRELAFGGAALAVLGMLALAQGIGPYVDVSAAAQRIKATQDSGRPIVHVAWHHGLFEFAGRMTQPLETVTYGGLRAWCEAHPGGEVVSFHTKYPITAKPDTVLPYRFGRIQFWHAADILTMPAPETSSRPDDEDDASDD